MKRGPKNGRKRQQLFGNSPAVDDDLHSLPSSVFSPNTSIETESPGVRQGGGRNFSRGNCHGNYASQKFSPQCGSNQRPTQYHQQTPEQQRSKQKFSLAEFMFTPDQSNNSNNWRKKSPHSSGKKDLSVGSSSHGRRSGGKKRHSYSPLVQNSSQDNVSNNCASVTDNAPVFSLASSNDFPPMGSGKIDKKGRDKRRSLDSNLYLANAQQSTCDNTRTSREINFSNNSNCDTGISRYAQHRLNELKRLSPVTVPNTPNVRRITPVLIKADNSVPQNPAFLQPIEGEEANDTVINSGMASDSKQHMLPESISEDSQEAEFQK